MLSKGCDVFGHNPMSGTLKYLDGNLGPKRAQSSSRRLHT
jgi:hypothetical protein